MKDFAELYIKVDSTTSSNRKIEYLTEYFEKAEQQDKLWVMALFSHKRPRRTVQTRLLREWAAEYADIPLWLFEETYHIVGDLAETIAKLEGLLSDPALYTREPAKFAKASDALVHRKEQLAAAEDEWLDLEDRAGG